MSKIVAVAAQVVGLIVGSAGVWQMWHPAGWVVGGASLVVIGIGLERGDA